MRIGAQDSSCKTSAVVRSRIKALVFAGGIASGMELGFHLLRRAGYGEHFIREVSRVMEYHGAYELYRDDIEYARAPAAGCVA